MVLDVSLRPDIKFIRAKWELNRWGRVAPQPMFVAGLTLEEIPPMSRDLPTSRVASTVSLSRGDVILNPGKTFQPGSSGQKKG